MEKKRYSPLWICLNSDCGILIRFCDTVFPLESSNFQEKRASRTPNKSLKRPATSSFIGYVHHLSPERRNKNNAGLREFYAANLSNQHEASSHLFKMQTAAVFSKHWEKFPNTWSFEPDNFIAAKDEMAEFWEEMQRPWKQNERQKEDMEVMTTRFYSKPRSVL